MNIADIFMLSSKLPSNKKIAGVQLLFGINANVQCKGKGVSVASAQRVILARTHDQRLQDLLTGFGWKWRSLHLHALKPAFMA